MQKMQKVKKVTVRHPTARELFKKKIPLIEMFRVEHQIVEVEFEKPSSNLVLGRNE